MNRFKQAIRPLALAALAAAVSIPVISWNAREEVRMFNAKGITDTLPERSIDAHIQKLEKAQAELERTLSNQDWGRVEKDLRATMEQLQSGVIEKEMERAMASLEKSKLQMQGDLKKMEVEMRRAEESMREAKKELEASREKMKEALQQKMPDMKKEMEKAKVQMEAAKKELAGYRTMIGEMEKEGLLKDGQDYRIEYRDSKLIINGQEQPKETADKYRKYFRKDPMTIRNDHRGFNVETDK